jgi:hypothetical protein
VGCREVACPQPVIDTKNALEGATSPFLVIVDNEGSCTDVSCIRRVVNLRMKCPSNFWKEENAEGFLHLRSLYKSGRCDASFMQTIESHAMQVAA